jgi:UDP-N-acetylglucosamine 1-carboxyvinyltransferase
MEAHEMDHFIIQGGNRLEGTIKISGAKNAILPIFAGSLLTQEMVILNNVPYIKDILIMNKLAQKCGSKIIFKNNTIYIKSNFLKKTEFPETMANQISSSLLLVGALLNRFPKVTMPLPGGCKIGKRELDLHIEVLRVLGASIFIKNGFIIAEANKRLKGTNITFKFPSVGATHHMIIASCLANGETIINKAAKEPEVVDLANFLNSMGAEIKGAGTSIVRINGVEKLGGTTYSIMPDRISTGTYMVAAAITEGNIQLTNTNSNLLKSVVEKLRETGIEIEEIDQGVRVTSSGEIKSTEIITEPYPGFPTDMQPIITTLLAVAEGESTIQENIFNNRFNHTLELKKMGADIRVDENIAIINGVDRFTGSKVTALDLRTGAALILAGLNARGKTVIDNTYQIDRGYENLVNVLKMVGANIERRISIN